MKKFSSSLFLSKDFLFHHHRRWNMLFAQMFMQSWKANRQSKVGVVNLVFSFAEIAKQFHQQESNSNEAQSTFSGGFLS